jgi:predicted Zn-dependent protease
MVTRLLARLHTAAGDDPAAQRQARLLEAETVAASGDAARVLRLVDATGGRRPELLLATQAQVQAGRGPEAAQRLQTWVATQPRDAAAWQVLASAYAAQGQQLRAVRAEAEARVAQLDFPAALDRFKAAQELARRGAGAPDYIESSIIDTRAREVESRVREQALER